MPRPLPLSLLLALAACDSAPEPCLPTAPRAGLASLCVSGALDLDLAFTVDQFETDGGQTVLEFADPTTPGVRAGLIVVLETRGDLSARAFPVATTATLTQPGTAFLAFSTDDAAGAPATFTALTGEVVVEAVAPDGAFTGRLEATAEDRAGVVRLDGRFRTL